MNQCEARFRALGSACGKRERSFLFWRGLRLRRATCGPVEARGNLYGREFREAA